MDTRKYFTHGEVLIYYYDVRFYGHFMARIVTMKSVCVQQAMDARIHDKYTGGKHFPFDIRFPTFSHLNSFSNR